MPLTDGTRRLCWPNLTVWLILGGAATAGLATDCPDGPPASLCYRHYPIAEIGDLVNGEVLADFRNPLVPTECDGKLRRTWEFCEFDGLSDPLLAECPVAGGFDSGGCDGSNASLPLDLNGQIAGHDPNYYWQDLDASRGEICDDPGYAATILDHVNPPSEAFVVAVDTFAAVHLLAELGVAMPDGAGATFTSFNQVAIHKQTVAIAGSGTAGRSGLYLAYNLAGVAARLVDDTQPRPRSAGNFGTPSDVAIFGYTPSPSPPFTDLPAGGEATYVAWSDGGGVYLAPADLSSLPVQLVAPGDTYAPGKAIRGPFLQVSFWSPDRLVFHATSQGFKDGIYSVALSAPGVITRHADDETTFNGGAGSFGPVQNPTAAGNTVFFEGYDASTFQYLGAFVDSDLADGPVEPFLRRNDPLDAKTVQTVVVNPKSAIRGGQAAMLVYFTNGTGAAYLFTETLFANGFETGGTGAWSATVP